MRALITGGSRGIGLTISVEMDIELGASCFTPSRSTGFDLSTPAGIDAMIIEADRRDAEAIEKTTVVVANVGGGGRHGTDEEVWIKNFFCMQRCIDWALPHMVEQGWGRVVTISSIHGREYGSRPVFMAAKAAQIAYMKGMSKNKDYVRRGITFNTVCPGNVLVEGKPKVDEEALPLGRMGRPDEVAKLVRFLCSQDAAYINGACVVIDGGESNAI